MNKNSIVTPLKIISLGVVVSTVARTLQKMLACALPHVILESAK